MKRLLRIASIVVCLALLLSAVPMIVSAAGTEVTYKITTKICDGFQNGTNSNKVNFTFYGTNGTHKIENIGRKIKGDAFERNKKDTYTFTCSDLGEVYGLNVSCGTDAVKFDYIKIERIESAFDMEATFTICEWIDNTNRTYYTNRDYIYRIKFVTGDNPTDTCYDTKQLVLTDTAGKTAVYSIPEQQCAATEFERVVYLPEKLGTLSTATLRKVKYATGTPDDWYPLYVQVERLFSSATAGNVKWEEEVLFIFDQPVIDTPVTVSRYNGTVKDDQASNLASIFFEPNFYVISGIVLALAGVGVATYLKNKKNQTNRRP